MESFKYNNQTYKPAEMTTEALIALDAEFNTYNRYTRPYHIFKKACAVHAEINARGLMYASKAGEKGFRWMPKAEFFGK